MTRIYPVYKKIIYIEEVLNQIANYVKIGVPL